MAAYAGLKASIDADAPGPAWRQLRRFGEQNKAYKVSTLALQDVSRIEAQAKERYLRARELARQGEYERAEKMLLDLVECFRLTPGGGPAAEFLRFEYPVLKANQLILHKQVDAAEQVLKEVQKHELSEEEMAIVERMLDGVSVASGALAQSRMAMLMSECRGIQVFLRSYFAEHDRYPETLTLQFLASDQGAGLRNLPRMVSAIEDYASSGAGFSFVAVGADGRSRVVVNQFEIKEQPEGGRVAR
jgi:hypothetical protein